MRWTIFRPSVIFGAGDSFTRELVDLAHRRFVPIINGGKALLQPVSLDNVVGPMARALRMPVTQNKVFEVGGPDRISFDELIKTIASHYKLRMNAIKVSANFMRPAVNILQRYESFPLTVDQLLMLVEDNVCDNEEYKKTFGIAEMDSYRDALPSLLEAAVLSSI
jgi:NADH dehydrogenase